MQTPEEFARDHLYNVTFDRLSDDTRARDVEWQARVDKLRTVLTGLLLAKDVLFRCVCEADDEEHLQSLIDSTDNLWNDARAALGREA